jgi:hypothetical protein
VHPASDGRVREVEHPPDHDHEPQDGQKPTQASTDGIRGERRWTMTLGTLGAHAGQSRLPSRLRQFGTGHER